MLEKILMNSFKLQIFSFSEDGEVDFFILS